MDGADAAQNKIPIYNSDLAICRWHGQDWLPIRHHLLPRSLSELYKKIKLLTPPPIKKLSPSAMRPWQIGADPSSVHRTGSSVIQKLALGHLNELLLRHPIFLTNNPLLLVLQLRLQGTANLSIFYNLLRSDLFHRFHSFHKKWLKRQYSFDTTYYISHLNPLHLRSAFGVHWHVGVIACRAAFFGHSFAGGQQHYRHNRHTSHAQEEVEKEDGDFQNAISRHCNK